MVRLPMGVLFKIGEGKKEGRASFQIDRFKVTQTELLERKRTPRPKSRKPSTGRLHRNHFQDPIHFGIGIVEVRTETNVLPPLPVLSGGTDDVRSCQPCE
jgi:hypothetical protein